MRPSNESQSGQVALKVDGASVVLRLRRLDPSACLVEFDLHVEFAPEVAASLPPRLGCRLHDRDLERLVDYMTRHMGADQPHGITESASFVTHDLDFQLQALEGEVEGLSDGYFGLRWMVYYGSRDRRCRGIYAGFESTVETGEVLRWCEELRSIRTQLCNGLR